MGNNRHCSCCGINDGQCEVLFCKGENNPGEEEEEEEVASVGLLPAPGSPAAA